MIEPFTHEPDQRRKEMMWLTLALLAVMSLALVMVVDAGGRPAGAALRWLGSEDRLVGFGLLMLLGCAIAYVVGKEREQRLLNQSLVESLRGAVCQLNQRVATLDELSKAHVELSASAQQMERELGESYLRAIQALMCTLDARDGYTALHGEQVATIATAIAERMGLDHRRIGLIRSLAPLHDIGKIGIPDQILKKPGALRGEETALCRQHAILSETIIAPLRPDAEALAMFRNHHERWDGQGYPDGLAGTNIPLLARILSVADAYHAMTSQRPYRPARAEAQAVREMVAQGGAQFDPDVVGVLAGLVCEGALDPRPTETAAMPTPSAAEA
jgi:HD-GYP domain-containing protein (c-di-GMP phosphodiesterase class II)